MCGVPVCFSNKWQLYWYSKIVINANAIGRCKRVWLKSGFRCLYRRSFLLVSAPVGSPDKHPLVIIMYFKFSISFNTLSLHPFNSLCFHLHTKFLSIWQESGVASLRLWPKSLDCLKTNRKSNLYRGWRLGNFLVILCTAWKRSNFILTFSPNNYYSREFTFMLKQLSAKITNFWMSVILGIMSQNSSFTSSMPVLFVNCQPNTKHLVIH